MHLHFSRITSGFRQNVKLLARLTAAALTTALVCLCLPVQAASVQTRLPLSPGLTYTRLTNGQSSADAVQSALLTYTPGSHTLPMIVSDDDVCGALTPEAALEQARQAGYTPVAAVNADFFTMSTGIPEGLLVTDGILRCSDSYQNAVGILPDGSVILGQPRLSMTLSGSGKTVGITYINKLRTNQGVYLLTSDFDDTSRLSRPGTNVLLRVLDGRDITIGGSVELEVESITHTDQPSALTDGYMLLTVSDDGPGEEVGTLAVGDRLTLSVRSGDTRWNNVVSACGAGAFLIADGQTAQGLSSSKKPLTTLGVRADGSVVILTADGRQTGVSQGMSLRDAAAVLAAEGCVSAVNLDGGGSTTLYSRSPGREAAVLSNVPSDGTVRKCANYLVFVNTAPSGGAADSLWLYPADSRVLTGSAVHFEALAADQNLQPAPLPGSVWLSGPGVTGSSFCADLPGTYTVTSVSGPLSGTASVTAVSQPDQLSITRKGETLTSLTVDPGQSVDLDAAARSLGLPLLCTDTDFVWTVEGGAGTINPDGVFTAGGLRGLTGTITLHRETFSTRIPVTVGTAPAELDGFESLSGWTADEGVTLQTETEVSRICLGRGSLRVLCAPTEENTPLRISRRIALSDSMEYLSLWVWGSSGMTLAPVVNAAGAEQILDAVLLQDGWQQLSFPLPARTSALTAFEITGAGTLRLDGLCACPDAPLSDTSTLMLSVTQTDASLITASVLDSAGYLVRPDAITLTADGEKLPFRYDASTGILTAAVSGYARRITLTAADCAGRLTQVYCEPARPAEAPVFADLDGHWALSFANALYERGIMNGERVGDELLMNPARATSRQEMAALVARYLGLNPADYEGVTLPFADADAIASWALPYVKAVYAEGLMQGSASGTTLVFHPTASVTRAEVIAILGRTLPRGFALSGTVYADQADVPAWAAAHLDQLAALQVIGGYPDGTVRPLGSVTRAEVAAMLYRLSPL